MSSIHETDVLVVGSGGAGCRAALAAFQAGARVTLVTKGAFGKSGTTAFRVADTAGYNVADGVVDPEDSPEKHYQDIIRAGLGMAYEELARTLATEALETVPYLERLGVNFEKDPSTGRYVEVKGCFATHPRMHLLKDHGEPIIKALVPEVRSRPIRVIEHTAISRLLVKDGRCVGAVGLNAEERAVVFQAKAVVLACGGAGQLFKYTLTPKDITGDGYALGLRAGADLVSMEFMQVVLGTVTPTRNQLNTFLWCARPRLLTGAGEPFLESYLPSGVTGEECMEAKSTHFPFSSRDSSRFIEIAVQKEIREGRGTPEGGVLLDLTDVRDSVVNSLPSESPLPKVWPIVREFLTNRGFAIEREPVQIACFAHAINGGLKTDVHGGTTVPGLYAAGEVAGGPHGADRLGGNMLVTCQVFGARAGRAAAKVAAQQESSALPQGQVSEEIGRLRSLAAQRGDMTPDRFKEWLQDAMWRGVLVVRSADSLSGTLTELADIRQEARNAKIQGGRLLRAALELENLLDVGEAITRAALRRSESRGSHYREDFPAMDPNWRKRILVGFRDGELTECEERSE